ncbi:phosphate/phosphite/phosphonate ABC transporter substrate-binding protein [Nocardiopsis sp. CNT312]|uniref:phosphate/phosphite/phosphonate ABC transporter substrate-binding protein n=1 Tax=Nocardiopsis sp. CNT312 TaxID=1137268 RepID=UPI00048CC842|nr:phosphate/phosphite/phosphonate ABC transporter substrate-binding protein [Nocardiopsis sp. CNT312]
MMRKRLLLASMTCLALTATACGGGNGEDTADSADGDRPDTLVLTLTPSAEQGELIESAQPLADMLEERLGIEVEPNVPTDYAGVIVALESGQADIAGGLGPRQMVQAEEQAGADLALQSERYGSTIYVTQWFTNDPDTYCDTDPVDVDGFLFCNGVEEATDPSEGPIAADTVEKVAGAKVAFVDFGSTSGYAVPSLQLLNAGVDPEEDIEPIFAGGHDNSVLAVLEGDADVGVSYQDARQDVADQAPDVGQEVVVFGWSEPIPNDGFALNGNLPEDLKQEINDALLDIMSTEEGAAVMGELYSIDDLLPIESSDYDVIRELEAELGDRLEE